ncbi:hypothetical protein AD949_09330 [Acetobacter orleanensis]|nr:hypothetical protein AD949_09330 [Acetobacter orleanensis]PCD79181.1 hypothetical protein CO710_07830 [Acetobacter orleanensis]
MVKPPSLTETLSSPQSKKPDPRQNLALKGAISSISKKIMKKSPFLLMVLPCLLLDRIRHFRHRAFSASLGKMIKTFHAGHGPSRGVFIKKPAHLDLVATSAGHLAVRTIFILEG